MTEKPEVVKSELDAGVENVTHAVAEITKMDRVIAELEQKYGKTIMPVDSPAELKAAKAARAEIRKPRVLIEKLRKAGKAPILDLGRKLDARAKHMTERLLAIEGPIDESIKDEEARAERERQEKIEAEMRRVEALTERVDDIRNSGDAIAWDSSSADIAAAIANVEKRVVDETFEEFQREAQDAKDATLGRLRDQHKAALDREAEEKRIAAERAELERLRAEAAERQAKEEAERHAREEAERKEREAKEAAERKKREAAEAKRRKELEAQRKKQAEEQARIDAENKRIADERAALAREQEEARRREEEAQRKKEAEERAEAERKRKSEEAARKTRYPGDDAIVGALVERFDVTEFVARQWLKRYGKKAQAA